MVVFIGAMARGALTGLDGRAELRRSMAHALDLVGSGAPSRRLGFATTIIVGHVFLVAALGQFYAKVQLSVGGLPLYATELVVLALAVAALGPILRVPWDGITKLVAAFVALGIGWVGLRGMGDITGAGGKAFSFFVYAIFYFAVRGCCTSDALRWRVLQAVLLASVVGAIVGLLQMQLDSPLISAEKGFEVTSTGSTRWLSGEFALYGMFSVVITIVAATRGAELNLTLALLLVSAAIEVILAQHRSGFVAVAAALLASVTVIRGSTKALQRLLKVIMGVAIGLAVAVLLFGGAYLADTVARISQTGDVTDINIDWRLLAWFEVFDGVVAQPLGHGFAQWDFSFATFDPLTGSHNSLLDLAYRVGIPGLLLFVAIPVALLRGTRAVVRKASGDDVLLVISSTCILAFIVFSLFNMVLEAPYMSIFFWVILGIGAGCLHDRRVAANRPS